MLQVKTMSSHHAGRHEAMEQQRRVAGSPLADVAQQRVATVCTGGLDPTVGVKRGADAERVPCAVGVPRLPGRVDRNGVGTAENGWAMRIARSRCPTRWRGRVQLLPGGADLIGVDADRRSDLGAGWCSTSLDELSVGQIADRQVAAVKPQFGTSRPCSRRRRSGSACRGARSRGARAAALMATNVRISKPP